MCVFGFHVHSTIYLILYLQVFDCELEKVGHYNGFDDFSRTFTLTRGKNVMDEESEAVGEFKVINLSLSHTHTHSHTHTEYNIAPDSLGGASVV